MPSRPTKPSKSDIEPSNLLQTSQFTSQHGFTHSNNSIILSNIPSETLTGITTYLDPPTLHALAAVSKYFYEHIKDDNTWHCAFVYRFLGIGPESNLYGNAKSSMLRRTQRTWRVEYIVRYNLRRRWERSRNTTTAHSPLYSAISSIHLMPSNYLLASSIQYGVVSRSLPLTGKVLPGYLDPSGSRLGLGNGNPNAEFAPNVSVCALNSDGGTAKIAWGFLNGEVVIMTSNRTMDQGKRITAEVVRSTVAEHHEGSVLDTVWDDGQAFVITSATDGRIKVWEVKPFKCFWTSNRKEGNLVPVPFIKLASSIKRGFIVGVMKTGDIQVWIGFDTSGLPAIAAIDEIIIPCPVQTTKVDNNNSSYEISTLYIDASNPSPTFLVSYENQPYFYKVSVDKITRVADITSFGDASFGPISSLRPFFPTNNNESSFIITGDHIGCVSVYNWKPDRTLSFVPPFRKFEAHEDGSSVTALHWNGLTLITGSARGSTHAWDALTFEHLRSFASPQRRRRARDHHNLEGREREAVKHILVSPDNEVLFVSVGDNIMAWQAGQVAKTGAGGVRGRHSSGTLQKKQRTGPAKYFEQVELKQSIAESKKLLQDETKHVQRAYGRERDQQSQLNGMGLSEIEAVEYVLMLSRDEARVSEGMGGPSNFSTYEDGIFEGDFDEDVVNRGPGMRSPSLSASSSSSSLSSRSEHVASPSGRNIPRVASSSSSGKIQVSPRYRAEPMEAGLGIESPPSPNLTFDTSDPDVFPHVSANASPKGTRTSKPSSLGQAGPSRRPGSDHKSPIANVWQNPQSVSPATSPISKVNPWVSNSPIRATGGHGRKNVAAEKEFDADLKLAIELSLIEARSRGENV